MTVVRVPLTKGQAQQVHAAYRQDQTDYTAYCRTIYSDPRGYIQVPPQGRFRPLANALFEELTPHKVSDITGYVNFWIQPDPEACWLEATLKPTGEKS